MGKNPSSNQQKRDKSGDKGRQKGDKADIVTNKEHKNKEKRRQKGDKADTVKGDKETKANRRETRRTQ